MRTEDFNFDLPDKFIAQAPLERREESKLLVLDKETKEVKHEKFMDIVKYLNEGDCLVLNNTRVMPARLFGNRLKKDEKIEILLLKEVERDTWEVMVRPGKKARPGHILEFGNGLTGEIREITNSGTRYIKFDYDGVFEEILEELGEMPLPPYITEKLEDGERYQTIYSKNFGSSAAPTAGLHFTESLLNKISEKGINIVYVTLHVGLGTFSPVRVENILDHHMHSEYYQISKETANIINDTKKRGNKIISVGTTSTRTLESAVNNNGFIEESNGWTDIFIYPGYDFKIVDQLITNFHLPESTLLMLVSALVDRETILDVYEIAKEKDYRFFSFGDAMFIK